MAGLDYYVELLEDGRRVEAFLRAIRAVVRPGDHVLDVGTGLGTYAREAAQAGARRVTAIESNPLAAAFARELGLKGERIRVLEGEAERAALEEPADVVLFEDYGRFAWHPSLRSLLESVRSRLIRPGARFVPRRIELFAAPVDRPLQARFRDESVPLPFTPEERALLWKRYANLPRAETVRTADLLGPAVRIGELRPEAPLDVRSRYHGAVRVARTASASGLAVWMKLFLTEEIVLDNDPDLGPTAWKQLILPFESACPVQEGEDAEIVAEVSHGPGPLSELWRWSLRGRLGTQEGTTANSLPGDLDFLRRGSPDFVPQPTAWHPAAAELFRLMDGKRSLREIAETVYNHHRSLFQDGPAALDWVFDVASRVRTLTE